MSVAPGQNAKRWYHEPWPWLLLAGPAIVVAAGLVTTWIAVKYEDGLVADDYYRQGLAINEVLRRESTAAALDMRARVMFGENRVRVFLTGAAQPQDLVLRLVHRTRAGLDRETMLRRGANGWYEGGLPPIATAHWILFIEDRDRNWRITGDWDAATQETVELTATVPVRVRP